MTPAPGSRTSAVMLLLRGGLVVDPSIGFEGEADVLIGDGTARIVSQPPEGVATRDVSGCWIVPGLVDLRAHLREPGEEPKEDLASGLAAAAAGGFTTVCAMPGTRPVNDNPAVTEALLGRAATLRGARLLPFGCITEGMRGETLTEMAGLRAAGAVGVTDDHRPIDDTGLLRRALEYAHTFGLLLMQHCEDRGLSRGAQVHEGAVACRLGLAGAPREAEEAAVARDLRVAALTGAPLHIAHVSSGGTVALLADAKARGVAVTADVTPHHLSFTDEAVRGFDTNAKVLPPLREAQDREALRAGLQDGTLDCVATDHAPHTPLDKRRAFDAAAPGVVGLELAVPSLLALVREGTLSRQRWVEASAMAPARLVGLTPGLASGDVAVIDPDFEWTVSEQTLRSKSHNTPLLGRRVRGAARLTFVGGEAVFDREESGP